MANISENEVEKLRECPMCGDTRINVFQRRLKFRGLVYKPKCRCGVSGVTGSSLGHAVKLWNTRAAQSAPVDLETAKAFKAIHDGYGFNVKDEFLLVDNPSYRPDNGEKPKLVVQLLPTPSKE